MSWRYSSGPPTPGPWAPMARKLRDGEVWDVAEVATGKVIAPEVASPPELYGETERTANARLIAAAPDLYEALAMVNEEWSSRFLAVGQQVAIAKALAKARGEA